jgi:D-alanine-D-alanine ligase
MKRLRVLVLLHDHLVPPESIEGLSPAEIRPFKMELDVLAVLAKLGHTAEVVPVGDDLTVVRRAITERPPDVCFNMLVSFHGVRAYDAYVASYFELLKTPYTGCNPRGLFLAGDKELSKKVLTYHRVKVPRFVAYLRGRGVPQRVPLHFPVIVKSLSEEASLGISQASIVDDVDGLRERVVYVHDRVGTNAIAEEYVEGRELSVGVLGNERVQVFPPIETIFGKLPPGSEPILTERIKWDLSYQDKIGLTAQRATDLDPGVEERIRRTARRVYAALNLSGYARIDLRLAPDGTVFVLEANPNPDLAYGEDFGAGAELVGITYEQVVQRILTLGVKYSPPWVEYAE